MFDAVNADARDGEAFERAEQYATQGVTDGNAVARFQWLEFKLAEVVIGFQHQDFVGFLKC